MAHRHRWGWTRLRRIHRQIWLYQSCRKQGCNAERRRKILG